MRDGRRSPARQPGHTVHRAGTPPVATEWATLPWACTTSTARPRTSLANRPTDPGSSPCGMGRARWTTPTSAQAPASSRSGREASMTAWPRRTSSRAVARACRPRNDDSAALAITARTVRGVSAMGKKTTGRESPPAPRVLFPIQRPRDAARSLAALGMIAMRWGASRSHHRRRRRRLVGRTGLAQRHDDQVAASRATRRCASHGAMPAKRARASGTSCRPGTRPRRR